MKMFIAGTNKTDTQSQILQEISNACLMSGASTYIPVSTVSTDKDAFTSTQTDLKRIRQSDLILLPTDEPDEYCMWLAGTGFILGVPTLLYHKDLETYNTLFSATAGVLHTEDKLRTFMLFCKENGVTMTPKYEGKM